MVYPVTPTLSVEAVQFKVVPVEVVPLATRLDGAVGGAVSLPAGSIETLSINTVFPAVFPEEEVPL